MSAPSAPGSGALVDLSHPFGAGAGAYPGMPQPEITAHLTREDAAARYGDGERFLIERIALVGNSGTYLDSPRHLFDDGADIAALPLERLVDLPAVVVDIPPGERLLPVAPLREVPVRGRAVLVRTGWDGHWGTPAYGSPEAPALTVEAAAYLVEQAAALVGIDSLNVDDTGPGNRPVHSALLGAGIPVVEHLCGLGALPGTGARFTAVPAPVTGLGVFPVRAFARLP